MCADRRNVNKSGERALTADDGRAFEDNCSHGTKLDSRIVGR
jgi:hypothetical protein